LSTFVPAKSKDTIKNSLDQHLAYTAALENQYSLLSHHIKAMSSTRDATVVLCKAIGEAQENYGLKEEKAVADFRDAEKVLQNAEQNAKVSELPSSLQVPFAHIYPGISGESQHRHAALQEER
jgi:hypothetical protein